MTGIGHGSAHAKVILLGEHLVLYGNPAISMPVPALTVTATARARRGRIRVDFTGAGPISAVDHLSVSRLDAWTIPRLAASFACEHLGTPAEDLAIEVHSEIRPGRGLGSSAALAGAIIDSVADLHEAPLTMDERYELIQHCEAFAHGRASGIDARTVTHSSGLLWFQDGAVHPLEVPSAADAVLTVVDTGVFAGTHRAVSLVAERIAALGADADTLLKRVATMTEAAVEDLATAQFRALGAKMAESQHILADLGVSCPAIDQVVATAAAAGAWGAKLSGGGMGGCVIALGDAGATERLTTALAACTATVVARIPLGQV
ncbi:mevalonate kinase [Nocardia sp. NPDC020380]|uniref:mevalonate kinase n=1 Tax=Nocardia sp. NPDC020380 TaxID=3364309 RepID=UPI003796CBBD